MVVVGFDAISHNQVVMRSTDGGFEWILTPTSAAGIIQAVDFADAALARPDLEAAARTETETAKADAIGNLKQLAAGDHTWP